MTKSVSYDEFFENYKNVSFKFDNYYKYTFTFKGIDEDGDIVTVGFGGNADDIYREYVDVSSTYCLFSLRPYRGESKTMSFYDY